MASIKELQDALQTEQTRAVDLAEKTLSSIDTIVGLTNWWLSFLSFGIALLALVGATVIYVGARRVAVAIAEKRIKSYLAGDEIKTLIQSEVQSHLLKRAMIMVTPPGADLGSAEPFRPPPQREEG